MKLTIFVKSVKIKMYQQLYILAVARKVRKMETNNMTTREVVKEKEVKSSEKQAEMSGAELYTRLHLGIV